MNLMLQVQWVTQASDFITLNWYKLLGVFGGIGGFVALLPIIWFGGPVFKIGLGIVGVLALKEIIDLKQLVLELIEEIKLLKEVIKNISESNKEELKDYLKNLIARSQKLKLALYDRMTKGENVDDLLEELNAETKEAEALINEPIESPVTLESSEEEQLTKTINIEEQEQMSANVEPKKKHKRKVKKVVVER